MNSLKRITVILLLVFTITPAFSKTAVELMNEGRMILFQGNITEGIRLLEEARRMDDKNLFIKLFLAKGYSWDNQRDKAKILYNEIISASGPAEQIYWEGKFGIAQVTSWDKEYDKALELYQEIQTSYKKMSKNFKLDVGLAIGDIYSWKLNNEEALGVFNKLLEENPENPVIMNRIAKIYLWKGEYQKSRDYTIKILSLYENDAESLERARVLDQIKTFTTTFGYDFMFYDTENGKGENVNVHTAMFGFNWQYSIPFKFFTYLTYARQNSIESEDPEKASAWNYDVDVRVGGIYRVTPLTFVSAAVNYTYDAQIFPDFSSELTLSRKMGQHIDLVGLYKYTYDKIDSAQTVDSKQYHLVSPGIIFYYNPAIYNRLQFYVESDSKDLNYSVLIHQHLSLNPEDIFQFYVFLSQGRSYMTFSDTSVIQKSTTYSVSFIYTHYFTPSWGAEFSTGLTTRVDSYSNYHAGLSCIYKW